MNQNGGTNPSPPKIMNLLKVDNNNVNNQTQKISSILLKQNQNLEEVNDKSKGNSRAKTSATNRSLSVSSRSSSGSEMIVERDLSQVERAIGTGEEAAAGKSGDGKILDVLSPARVNQVLIPKWMLAGKFTNNSGGSSNGGCNGCNEKSNNASQLVQTR